MRQIYLEAMAVRNYSAETIKTHGSDLRQFLIWCDERSLTEPTEVTQPIVERYQRWLFYHRRPNGRPLTFQVQSQMLRAVRAFFKWLTRQHLTLFNPAAEIELPRYARKIPRDVLSAGEAEAVLAQPDVETVIGVRDRAILETFYGTGIRRRELANLSIYDVDMARETLLVREGKYRKDRLLPIGERARCWIDKYLADCRPQLVTEPDDNFLFLTVDGTPYRKVSLLNDLVNRYITASQIPKKGSCHIFRHTMATLMLENGADIRFIQAMLGHADLTTTDVYTRVAIGKLQQIYRATHPAERPGPAAAPTSTSKAASPADVQALLEHDDVADDEDGVTS